MKKSCIISVKLLPAYWLVKINMAGVGKYSILILTCLLVKTVEILLLTLVFKEGLGPSWARNVVRWALLGAG